MYIPGLMQMFSFDLSKCSAMRKIIGILMLSGIVCLNFSTTGCKKIIEVQTIDSMAVVNQLLPGKWFVVSGELETYAGGTLIDKKFEYYSNPDTYIEYKQDSTYDAFFQGIPNGNGSWELLSPYYFVLNRDIESEARYYYIMKLDKKILITHGPYKENGTLYNNLLYTFYYSR